MVHNFDREVSGIMERFVPMVTVRRRGGDAAWFDGDCRRAFELKQSAYHRWCRNRSAENWGLFCQAQGTANRLYAAAKARYSADCRRNLDDCASANAWWCTLKSHVFGAESDIPPLCSPGGALVSDPAGKAELLSMWPISITISITPVLSKVFERLIALRFGRFLESSGVLPSHQYSYRKRLGTCDALFDIVCAGQLELDRGGELALVQIDFSAAFDRVNHGSLVFKLRVSGLIL